MTSRETHQINTHPLVIDTNCQFQTKTSDAIGRELAAGAQLSTSRM